VGIPVLALVVPVVPVVGVVVCVVPVVAVVGAAFVCTYMEY